MSEQQQLGPDIVKWYTRARRFPQLIGRTPDGAKIPGGPYTVTQAVGAGVLLVVGLNTMGLWAQFGLIGNILVLATVTWTAVWLLGRIPVGSRNPLSVVTGLAHAVGAPTTGRLGGHAVRIRRPRQLRHMVVLALTDTTPLEAHHELPKESRDRPPLEVDHPKKRLLRFPARQRPAEPLPAPQRPKTPSAAAQPVLEAHRAPLTGVQALLANHPTATTDRNETETHR